MLSLLSRIKSVSKKWGGNILWLFFKYPIFKRFCFAEFKGIKTKTFKWTKWHDGARCFTGKDAQNSVFFIKTDGDLELSCNEAKMSNLFYSKHPNLCPKIVYSRLEPPIKVLVFELVPWINLEDALTKPNNLIHWESFLMNLINLISSLHKQKILHRDLTPSNILINTKNNITKVKVIDFAFAIFPYDNIKYDRNIDINKLATLGQGLNPQPLLWDDAFSALKITERIEQTYGLTFSEHITILKNLVGKLSYSYDGKLNSQPVNQKQLDVS